jgi:DNA repair protein RecN (Recombination protein N)
LITELHITHLAAIEDALIDLGPGFTAVTGETGAGKTMVVTAVALLLGARADAAMVREGAEAAVVEGRVALGDRPALIERVEEIGGVIEDGELLVSRRVNRDGRSRAWVGGRAVPVGVLGDLIASLVLVHGQSDQVRLRSAAWQRDSLDTYAGIRATLRRDMQSAYERYRSAVRALATSDADLVRVQREMGVLTAIAEDVERIAPQPSEDTRLADDSRRLSQVDALREASSGALLALEGGEAGEDQAGGAVTGVARARHELAAVDDPELTAVSTRLGSLIHELNEAASELTGYLGGLDSDPARLERVENRRAELSALVRRIDLRCAELVEVQSPVLGAGSESPSISVTTVDDLLALMVRIGDRLGALGGGARDEDARRAEMGKARHALTQAARALSVARAAAAGDLADRVTSELHGLALPDARLDVVVEQSEATGDLTVEIDGRGLLVESNGVDSIRFDLVAHAGAPPRPLHKGASGGELSRVMLALEVVLASANDVPTFVFDEVDAGVGGRAAIEVGRRLAALATHSQVLVVTHLPQVAAFADSHVVVSKGGQPTRTVTAAAGDEERIAELTRMMAGLEESQAGRDHARELVELAAEARRVATNAPPVTLAP